MKKAIVTTVGVVIMTALFISIRETSSKEEPLVVPQTRPSSGVASSSISSPTTATSTKATTTITEVRNVFPILIGIVKPTETILNGSTTKTTTTKAVPKPEVTENATVTPPVKITLPTPVIKQELTWGVFTGSNPTTIADFESRISENPDYLAYFIHWANGGGKLPVWLKSVAGGKKRTLVIFWEASDYTVGGTDQPAYSYQSILNGDHDAYITSFAKQLRDYKEPIILIPFSELNGDWTPWSGTKNGNTPVLAVEAFRYVHGFFDSVPNVKFGLALNAESVPNTPENALNAYYPGDAYVDYVGLDGFNMGDPWLSFNEIFGNGLKVIAQYGKPMFIFSFATSEGNGKAGWMRDAFAEMTKYPLLKGFIYFNQNKERNWLLWSDTKTLKAFTEYVKDL